MLRRKPTVGDVVRIGGRITIRTILRRRGRRTEVVQLIDADGQTITVERPGTNVPLCGDCRRPVTDCTCDPPYAPWP